MELVNKLNLLLPSSSPPAFPNSQLALVSLRNSLAKVDDVILYYKCIETEIFQ